MHIEHVALWTTRLEEMKQFYSRYFGARCGANYVNPAKAFESCFLTFGSGARLELMHHPAVMPPALPEGALPQGLVHLAFSAGSREAVQQMTETLRQAGYAVVGEPRLTGDGYYESVVLDPDGNRLEITV